MSLRGIVFLCYLAVAGSVTATPQFTNAQDSTRHAVALSADYLRPGDVVRLRIWREPDLSGDFPVSETGVIVLPRLGPLTGTGMPFDSFRQKLIAQYTAFLTHPSVEVTRLRRIKVVGAVRNPGLYPVDPTLTISDVVALAGGPTLEGRRHVVHLIRQGQTTTVQLSSGVLPDALQLQSGDEVYLPERSWLARNAAVVASAATASVGVIITLLLR